MPPILNYAQAEPRFSHLGRSIIEAILSVGLLVALVAFDLFLAPDVLCTSFPAGLFYCFAQHLSYQEPLVVLLGMFGYLAFAGSVVSIAIHWLRPHLTLARCAATAAGTGLACVALAIASYHFPPQRAAYESWMEYQTALHIPEYWMRWSILWAVASVVLLALWLGRRFFRRGAGL